jgi:alkanesulfonate monooxygenase SsuD/methylene tetrahydromethanopterin reductase-like flavin-dependent oxidoreductase (luciferase family)
MFIGYFTERPYQDPESGYFGATGKPVMDLGMSNASYDPKLGADLYHRYFDERIYAEEMGFDGVMLNEHHSTPFCMGGVMNVEAAITARITQRAKIVLLGNVLPIWDDPLWLAEELAMIDMISRGRLVTGWVRGTGRESIAHNAQSPYNWERFQEAHDFIIKAWTEPGPFRWEGEHYQYPYVMLATDLEPTKTSFDYYHEVAREHGHNSGSQNIGYLWKVHVDETEELAEATGRKYIQGPSNPFLEGNQGIVRPFIQNLPGMTSRTNLLPTIVNRAAAQARGQGQPAPGKAQAPSDMFGTFDEQVERLSIITGTPDSVIPKIRSVLEYLRPGSVFFWDGDGAMDHSDAMRSLRLFGQEVLPAVREISDQLELKSPFELDPKTGVALNATAG